MPSYERKKNCWRSPWPWLSRSNCLPGEGVSLLPVMNVEKVGNGTMRTMSEVVKLPMNWLYNSLVFTKADFVI